MIYDNIIRELAEKKNTGVAHINSSTKQINIRNNYNQNKDDEYERIDYLNYFLNDDEINRDK